MLLGVRSSPGSARKSYLPFASSLLAAAFSKQGCQLPQEPHEGALEYCVSICKFCQIPNRSINADSTSAQPSQDDSLYHLAVQDPDNTVREAAGDALGQIAEHLYVQHSAYSAGEIMSNPVLRAAHDTMLEHKKEVQQAGAYALSKVDLKLCLRIINNVHAV